MEDNVKNKDKPKRSVGRPPKERPNLANKVREGVCKSAKNKDNILEFEYDCPQAFKQIIAKFKKMQTNVLLFEFTPTSMYIRGKDHRHENECCHHIHVKHAIRYFCKKDFKFIISLSNLEDKFKNINSNPTNMCIMVRENEERKRIHIVFQKFDPACKSDNTIPVQDISIFEETFSDSIPTPKDVLDKYPLRFTMGYSTINDHIGASNANILQISKYEDHPLTFKYINNSHSDDTIDQFTDPNSIDLYFNPKLISSTDDNSTITSSGSTPDLDTHSDTDSDSVISSDVESESVISSDEADSDDLDTETELGSETDSASDIEINYIKINVTLSSIAHIVKTKMGEKIHFYINDCTDLLTVIHTSPIVINKKKTNTITVYNYTKRM